MAFYGADVDELRAFARQLAAGAESLEDARRALQSSVTGARWTGPDGDKLRGQWSSELSPILTNAATTLRRASDRVKANADDQQATSAANGGGAGAAGGPGGTGGGGGAGGGGGSGHGAGGDAEAPDETGFSSNAKGAHEVSTDNGSLGSPATHGTDAKVGGGVSYDPDSGETTYSGNGSLSQWADGPKGSKVTFGVTGGAEYTTGQKSEDGFTTYTSKSDVSIGVEGGVEKGGTGVSGGYSTGVTAAYEVKVPDAAKDVDPGSINPFDPHSIPVGGSVKMDGGDYTKTELNAAYHHIAVESSVKDSSGVSSLVERVDENTVRVTSGPTDAIANTAGMGVDIEGIKAMVSNTTSLAGTSLQTADFDLSTPEGQAAYNHYLVTGEIPKDASTGVSGLTKIARLDYDSATKAELSTPIGGFEKEVGQNTGSKVMTTYPDGRSDVLLTATYGDRGDFQMSQSLDASGKEDMSARTYSYDVKADDLSSQVLNSSKFYPQGVVPGTVDAGDNVTLTFTQAQMNAYADKLNAADPIDVPMDLRAPIDGKWTGFTLAAYLAGSPITGRDAISGISDIHMLP